MFVNACWSDAAVGGVTLLISFVFMFIAVRIYYFCPETPNYVSSICTRFFRTAIFMTSLTPVQELVTS